MPPTQITIGDLFLKCFGDHELFFGILSSKNVTDLTGVLQRWSLSLDPDSLTSLANRLQNTADKDDLVSIANTTAWKAWEVTKGRGPWNP